MSLKHGFESEIADAGDSDVLKPSNWGSTSTDYEANPTHVFDGGALGSLLYRDTGAVDGSNWLADVAVGSVLASAGVGVAPAWSATPTLTSLKLGAGSAAAPALADATLATTGPFWEAGPIFSIAVGGTKRFGLSTSAMTASGIANIQGGRIDLSAASSQGAGIHIATAADLTLHSNGATGGAALRSGTHWLVRGDTGTIGFAAASNVNTNPDTTLSRLSAGVIGAGTGAVGETDGTFIAGTVGIGTSSPNAAALLDVSSTTRGFLPPRMTETQRDAIATPPAGLVIYNTTTGKLNLFTSAWEALTSA